MRRARLFGTFSASLALAACATLPVMADTATQFADDATGLWHSGEQSVSETYDFVASQMMRVMPDREDGVWLFQQNWILGETAGDIDLATGIAQTSPYFQVVIQIRDMGDGQLHTTTRRLANTDARAAARQLVSGEGFDPDWVGETACMGQIQRVGDGFWTGRATCPNSYKDGVKVESRSVRSPGAYVNWDRGFDVSGQHIWGPDEGGYIFKKAEYAE